MIFKNCYLKLKDNLQNKMSVQMMALTFICVLMLSLISTYLQVYSESEKFKSTIHKELELLQNQVEILIGPHLQNKDFQKIKKIIKALSNKPYIAYVELHPVTDNSENYTYQEKLINSINQNVIIGKKPNIKHNNTIIKTFTITYQNQDIGYMEIISEPEFISSGIHEKLGLIISLNLFIAISISATILLLMHAMLIKHLTYLAGKTKEFSVNNIDSLIHLPNRKDCFFHNELDILVESINKMQKTISKEIKANAAQNAELKNQRDFSNTLLNSCNLMICRLDPEFKILRINAAATLQTGYLDFEVQGKYWADIFVDPSQRTETKKFINNSTFKTIKELTMRDQNNRVLSLEWNFVPFYEENNLKYHIAFGYDITKLKEAQQKLIDLNNDLESKIELRTQRLKNTNEELFQAYQNLKEAQKQLIESETMASLGSLVAGIAHEINTPLGIAVTAHTLINEQVKQITKLSQQNKLDPHNIEEIVDIINEADEILNANLNRASQLIKSFKQVAVDSSSQSKYLFNLNQNINQTIMSLSNIIKKEHLKIEIKCPNNCQINSYPGALNQIYTNLIMNSVYHAFENMHEQKTINISVNIINDNVVIHYRDNGCGINPDIISKIFEPFVTTKRGHGGSGLGANIIYNLTTKVLGGKIECSNLEPPLHGAYFVLTFPATYS